MELRENLKFTLRFFQLRFLRSPFIPFLSGGPLFSGVLHATSVSFFLLADTNVAFGVGLWGRGRGVVGLPELAPELRGVCSVTRDYAITTSVNASRTCVPIRLYGSKGYLETVTSSINGNPLGETRRATERCNYRGVSLELKDNLSALSRGRTRIVVVTNVKNVLVDGVLSTSRGATRDTGRLVLRPVATTPRLERCLGHDNCAVGGRCLTRRRSGVCAVVRILPGTSAPCAPTRLCVNGTLSHNNLCSECETRHVGGLSGHVGKLSLSRGRRGGETLLDLVGLGRVVRGRGL